MTTSQTTHAIPSIDNLLERSRQLEIDALAEIHELLYPEVYRYLRFRLQEEQVVEDLASEVFLRFLDALHHRKGPDRNLRGWLLGTAAHLVVDYFRHKYRHKEESLGDHHETTLASEETTETTLEMLAVQKDIRSALKKLTFEQQHVLALRFADERSLEETAQLVGKNVSAVKALQFRALKTLRKQLAEE